MFMQFILDYLLDSDCIWESIDRAAHIPLDPNKIQTQAHSWITAAEKNNPEAEASRATESSEEVHDEAGKESARAQAETQQEATARGKRARAQPRWMKDFVMAETR